MEIRFKCKKCNKENIIEVDDEIDITGKKNLLTELLNSDYFKHKCAYCDEDNLIIYPLLIKDSFHKFYIRLNHENKKLVLIDTQEAYKIRIVKDLNELSEKLRIFNSFLDDEYIESIKYQIKRDLEEHNDNLKIDNIYFYKVEKGFLYFILFDKENYLGSMKYNVAGYFKLEEKFKDKINKLEQVIDEDYIIRNKLF